MFKVESLKISMEKLSESCVFKMTDLASSAH